jgi:hypothetical protein
MAEFGFAYTLGVGISQPIQNAITKGFEIGVAFMTKPFEYFAKNLQERIQDEQSDIKAAGGIFSIARRQKDPFVKTMDEAMEFTQTNNKYMAELAAALPGNTQQYIDVSKRISDSISRIVMSDPKKAIEYSNKLREEEGKQDLSGSTQAQTKGAITQLLGEMTKKTVLAGLGTGGGPGGVAGAYGLPQLTERMLTQDQVSMGQFQRYAAIFKDPLIMDALNRFIPKINASAAGTMDRFEVMQKFYDEVLPKEMIRKFERSTAGVLELFNTTIFGPETGLFGLGRKMEGMGKVMDDYGNYIKVFEDGTREVVQTFGEASDANLSLFDLLRDSFANLGIALYPILESLSLIFDPLNKVSKLLVDFRHLSGEFLNSFESYKKGFEDMVKGMDKGAKAEFLKIGVDLRASLAAVNNFFANAGIINEGQFQANAKQLMSSSFDVKAMMGGMLDTFLNSKKAGELGELIGTIIGTVFSEVSKVSGFLSGRIGKSSKLFEGIKSAFVKAKGPQAITNIFKDVFGSLVRILFGLGKLIPFEGYLLAAMAIALPAAVQGIGMAIAQMVTSMLGMARDEVVGSGRTGMRRARGAITQGVGDAGGGGRGSFFQTRSMRRRQLLMQRSARRRAAPYMQGAQTLGAFGQDALMSSRAGRGFAAAGRGIGAVSRVIPGAALVGGAVDLAASMASGESFGEAAVGAFGTILGGTVGSIFGPAGTIIGGIAGKAIADASSRYIIGVFDQNQAAKLQIEAGQKQLDAATESAKNKYGEAGDKLGGVEALNKALGGGAGVKAYADEQLRLGKILPEQAQSWSILGTELTTVNAATAAVEKNQRLYSAAVKGNTGEQLKYKTMLEAAKEKQKAALDSITKNWEGMSSTNRIKILSAADDLAAAIRDAANKVRNITPAPRSPTSPGAPITGPRPGSPMATSDQAAPKIGDTRVVNGKKQTYNGVAWRANGGLGDAIASELRHKPSGSNLVIANSSETVIPAAGGHGMEAFIGTMRSGFNSIVQTYLQVQQKQQNSLNRINSTLVSNQQQTNTRLSTLETKFSSPSMGGLGGGSIGGGVDSFTGMAQKFGLQMTSGYRPGDPGWHGANRARDYSNGTGPTPQMMQFAQMLASNYGSNLKELIYTPLGFSIKNGQRVPPYATAGHYNHVHVAYANGIGQGMAFNSLKGAQAWENSMVSGSVKVGSVTANSGEGFGGSPVNVTNNISISQQPGQSMDELASIVAIKIGEAVADARAASIFV